MKGAPGKHAHILKYGARWPADALPLQIELECIKRLGKWTFGKDDRKCGNGLPFHVKEAIKILWPDRYFHRWTDMLIEQFLCDTGRFGVFGPSSSQKSGTISMAALVMYYARPIGTTVLISSTSLSALQRRIWSEITEGHRSAKRKFKWLPGKLVESKTMLLNDEKEAESVEDKESSVKNGVIGVAAKIGNTFRGLADYIGLKNDVVIVVCDELQFVPMAIVDSLANLESNDVCFMAGMGNLPDIHNPLAKLCEPKLGWESLPKTEKSRVWATRWKNGRAVQLIGMDSPNLDFPEGQEPYKGLIGRRYIEQCKLNYGEGTDKYNMFASGELPSGNMDRTVFKKSDCIKFNASADVRWGHNPFTRGYMLDAAYSGIGGDRTVGAPFIFGQDTQGIWRFWCGTLKVYPGSTQKGVSHSEAIALEVRKECEAHGIPPEHVFFDGTGRSELTSAFARHWSPAVVPVEFGGPATERPSFTGERFMYDDRGNRAGDQKMCRDVFDRFVTELWFALATCIRSDQMRGMSEEVIEEGCQRKWEFVRGNKYCIETKEEMKERGLRSPDLCFCEGTLIATPRGQVRIENLTAGDCVLTPLGMATIKDVRSRFSEDICRASFSDGTELIGTFDHKVFTWNRGWVSLDTLTLTDEIESSTMIQLWNTRNELFTRAEHTSFKALVDTIKTETGRVAWTDFYTDASGSRRMVQFLKASVSIIKTEIGQTIASKISSLWGFLSTCRCTLKIDQKGTERGFSSSTPLGSLLLQHGTNLKQEESGTHGTQRTCGEQKPKAKLSAQPAELISSSSFMKGAGITSALPHAPRNFDTGKSSWLGRVRSVAQALRLTNTNRPSIAPISVERLLSQESKKVFTLSLDQHRVYYANGILVANCDALVVGIEGARRLGFPLGKSTAKINRKTTLWVDAMREKQWNDLGKDELQVAV